MPLDARVGKILRLTITSGVQDLDSAPAAQLDSVLRSSSDDVFAELAEGSRFHGISGYTYEALRLRDQVPAETRESLRRLRDGAALRHLTTVADLGYLQTTLGAAGIPWMIVKGPTLAEPVHGSAHRRSYGDLDALVNSRSLRTTLEVLEATGSTVTDRNWTLIHAEMKGEVHIRLPSGTDLDLHWHLYNERERRERFPVAIDELFERRRLVTIGGREIATLSFSDTVVYIAMHTMHSGGHRLLWLKDLERLLAHPEADPAEIAERARTCRAELVLVSGLRRVELALGAPPHMEELRRACPRQRGWLVLATWAWRRTPAEQEDGYGSLGRIVSRSIGRDQRESVVEFGRRSILHLRHGRSSVTQPGGRSDPSDPGSDRFDAGGVEGRNAFLDAVERTPT